MCIERMPRNESVVTPRSHCLCGHLIRWYDNIPILSWLLLKAKARCCDRKLPIRYLVVEILTGLLFLFCWIQFPPAKAIATMVFCAFLVGAAFIDWEHLIVPDVFSLGGALTGIILSFIIPSLHGGHETIFLLENAYSGWKALSGLLIGSGIIFWIRELGTFLLKKEAMGYGDIAFAGMIGTFCGWQGATFAIFGGAIVGLATVGIYRISPVFFKKDKRQPAFNSNSSGRALPFGPMLAIGALIYLLLIEQEVIDYFKHFILH